MNILDYPFIKPLNESLSFREYDSTIAYTLKNIRLGINILTYKPTMIKNNSKEYFLSFNSIPEGKYLLTVWGNVTEENFPFGYLHPKEQESEDVYIVSDTLVFSNLSQQKTLNIERLKGLLYTEFHNLPSYITNVDMEVSSVYEKSNSVNDYSGISKVKKRFIIQDSTYSSFKTYVSPSLLGIASKINISFLKADKEFVSFKNIPINIKRNYISNINFIYNPESKKIELWIWVKDQWELIHNLEIIEN